MKSLKNSSRKRRGVVFVLAMIFLALFTSISVSMVTMTSANAQMAKNHHNSYNALRAAESGLQCAKYILKSLPVTKTGRNWVSEEEAETMWQSLCSKLTETGIGNAVASSAVRFTDSNSGLTGDRITVGPVAYDDSNVSFTVSFSRFDDDFLTIKASSEGSGQQITRTVNIESSISKSCNVMQYAIASRGRMWLTGNSTIKGPVFSTWDKPEWAAPLLTTSETVVEGTLSTVLSKETLEAEGIQMETLDEFGNPVFDECGDRAHSFNDTVQGEHEGIKYDQDASLMPGLDEDDYDTSMYKAMCSTIPYTSKREREYFPHKPGNYKIKKSSSSYTYDRSVYENQIFTNATLPRGRHALFKNCTFKGILYIETTSYTTKTSRTNNVRFEDCDFKGSIVTDIPKNNTIKWVQNCLYFTGEANFDNQSDVPATILAPNFNVNLGNTGVVESGDGNVISGAIIGGIVDVRGNAEIEGTIISMYDTTVHSSGYVTNIGFADDGGSEGGVPGDIGTIKITPKPDMLLPSGITTPIVISVQQSSYSESI